jgi:non-lysosomal glucosylceramidase
MWGWFAVALACAAPCHGQVTPPAIPRVESVSLPGWSRQIPGRWLTAARNASGVPLGGLGTGFIEIRPDSRVHDTCLNNDWIKPRPPLLFRLTATTGTGGDARTLTLLSSAGDTSQPVPARYLGHYPVAELDCAQTATTPAAIRIRAFSPFVPGDADLSNVPAALVTVFVRNTDARPLPVRLDLHFSLPGGGDTPPERFHLASGMGIEVRTGTGSGYAIAGSGVGWQMQADNPATPYGDTAARVFGVAKLAPGEEKALTLVIGWYAPRWTTSDGKAVRNRYALRFADARGVATFALERAAVIEQRIWEWQSEVYGRQVPDWLKDALVNSLYALARNSIWLDDGRLLVNESFTGRPVTESVACRFNSSWPLLLLFPDQEKQAMRAIAKLQATNGEIPFGLGAPAGIENGMFGAERPILSTEFALMCWRDFARTQDVEFLVGLYPRIKRALQYAMTLDTDNDGLINESPGSDTGFPSNQFYDRWPWFGTSAYTAGLGLAALRAGEEAAKRCGDEEFAKWCRERFEKGRAAYEDLLWTGDYYRLYADPEGFRQSDTCLADQLAGQTAAWLTGLGDILPPEHTAGAIRSVARFNAKTGAPGFVAGVKANGEPDESGGSQSRDVVLAEALNAESAALWIAARRDDSDMRRSALSQVEWLYDSLAAQGRTWDQPFILSAKDGSPVEGRHYTGNLVVWAAALALERKGVAHPPAPTGK